MKWMDAALDAMVHFVNRKPSPACAVVLEFMHGAVQRVAADATAFAHRGARHSFLMLGQWASQAQTENGLCWVREFWEAMRPYLGAGSLRKLFERGRRRRADSRRLWSELWAPGEAEEKI